jgi:hypothetical protein
MDLENLSTEELRERAELINEIVHGLKTIDELAHLWPTEEEAKTVSEHLHNLKEIEELEAA